MWRTGDPKQEEKKKNWANRGEEEEKKKASYGFKRHIMERTLALL